MLRPSSSARTPEAISDRWRARDYDDLSMACRRIDFERLLVVADAKMATPLDRGMLAQGFRDSRRVPDRVRGSA
ncbi:MAG: hypothetical protein FWF28_04915 [Micrococcales bacterium]|nr:hypothetical protein [Micrococcales bacterium]